MLGTFIALTVTVSITHAQPAGWQPHGTWSELPVENSLTRTDGQRLSEQPQVTGLRVSRPGGLAVRRPRRGRIVARIHSSDLSIPALHSRYTNPQSASKQPAQTFPAFAECSELCPPPWMSFVNNLRGLAYNVTEPVCAFSEQFSPCSVENEVCGNAPVPFRCCPKHCVEAAMACYNGPPTEFLCVPKTIQPWIRTMLRLFTLGQRGT